MIQWSKVINTAKSINLSHKCEDQKRKVVNIDISLGSFSITFCKRTFSQKHQRESHLIPGCNNLDKDLEYYFLTAMLVGAVLQTTLLDLFKV